ncbi:unnamed protein product [Ceutorhynchus assimilis]|uniref:Uncharacterized protein n=1 Tax=Ceutorhynchus assimilis TaxID=467358 RepID=A0A9N9N189_9CUCU|nr:unnamed protein product [Ceutorhynchus assimilis]
MSSTKKYDIPGYILDRETGLYSPGNLDEIVHLYSARKSPRNITKANGRASSQIDSKKTERGTTKRPICNDLPGFIRDPETGKFKAVPFDVKDLPIFKNTPANENLQPNKFQKNDQGVRKELFTKPLPVARNARPSLRQSYLAKGITKPKPLKKSALPSIIITNSDDTQLAVPLPPTPVLNLRPPKQLKPSSEPKSDDILKISKTQELILEKLENIFKLCQENNEKLEKVQQVQQQQGEDIKKILTIVATQETVKERTPLKQKLSSLHPKLYSTKQSASKKPSTNISSIQEEEDLKTPDSHAETDEFVKMEQLCMTPKNASLTPVSSVCNLFKTMDVDEESPKRRSLRLKGKLIIDNQVSPIIMKSDDLRKKTLTRSLVKKYQADSPKSPRTQKAFDMYVSTKKDYGYLLTPSFSKDRPLSDSGNSARKRISQKVQQQCLLLQDTP